MYYNFGDGYYSQELKKRQFEEGKQLFDRGEYAAAVALFRRAATDCYQSAECYLGYCHSHGLGVERNLFEALRWYRFQDRYVSWVKKDVETIRAEIEASGAADSREPVIFTDDKLGEIRVIFSANVNYPQVRFNAGYIGVTLHTSQPYDAAVAAICKALVNADWRRQKYDYGRIDENFQIDYPLFSLSVERGKSDRYSYRCEGDRYTIITPQSVDFDLAVTREYIIAYGVKLLKRAAEEFLPKRIAHIAKQTGLYYSRCKVVNSTKYNGMYFCNSGVVYLDYNLMKCSAEFIDTVILHELVHSICKNHDKRFYETMSRYGTERAVAVDKENIGYNGNREL